MFGIYKEVAPGVDELVRFTVDGRKVAAVFETLEWAIEWLNTYDGVSYHDHYVYPVRTTADGFVAYRRKRPNT